MSEARIERGKATVLVVSDDILARITIHRLIATRIPATVVHEARSGATALDMLRRITPRVIVTESTLADMQGVSLMIKAAYFVPHARTIIIGEDPGGGDDVLARAAGLFGYLPKEYLRARLVPMVEAVLDQTASRSAHAEGK